MTAPAPEHIPHATVRVQGPEREALPAPRLALWLGFLAGPVAFAANHQVSYMLVPWACVTARYGIMQLPSFVAAAVTLAGTVLSWRIWRRAGGRGLADVAADVDGAPVGGTHGDAGGADARTRFLGLVGVLSGLGFFLVVLAQWIPSLLLGPCQRAG